MPRARDVTPTPASLVYPPLAVEAHLSARPSSSGTTSCPHPVTLLPLFPGTPSVPCMPTRGVGCLVRALWLPLTAEVTGEYSFNRSTGPEANTPHSSCMTSHYQHRASSLLREEVMFSGQEREYPGTQPSWNKPLPCPVIFPSVHEKQYSGSLWF